MRALRSTLKTVIIAFVSCSAGPFAIAAPTLQDLQENIIAYRSKIKQGTLEIKTVVEVNTEPGVDYSSKTIAFRIVFNGNSIRSDRNQVEIVAGRPLTLDQRRVIANDQYIYDETFKSNVAVEIGRAGRNGSRDDMSSVAADDVFNPRVCGLVLGPIFMWDHYGLEDAVAAFAVAVPVITEEQLSGQRIVVLKWSRMADDGEQHFIAHIARDQGYALLKEEVFGPGEQSTTMDASYEQVSGAVWFPKRITYQESRGGEPTYREVTTIVADFSKIINQSAFSLEALHLKAGRLVRNFGTQMIWDGAKLIDRPLATSSGERRPASEESGPLGRVALFANAILFSVVACILIVRWFGRRRVGS